jgi:hypothetical protein
MALRDRGIYPVAETMSGRPNLICYEGRNWHGSGNIYFPHRWGKLMLSFEYAFPVMAILFLLTLLPIVLSFLCTHKGSPSDAHHFYQCGFFAWAVWGWKCIAVIGVTVTAAFYWFKYTLNKDGRG